MVECLIVTVRGGPRNLLAVCGLCLSNLAQLARTQHSEVARAHNRKVRFGLNGFVIVRDTEAEACDQLCEIIAHADAEAVEGFRESVQTAGAATSDKKGMWADSSFEDLVQYNDGFRTQLIGTPEQVADRIIEYKKIGVDLILTGFLHFQEELEAFGKTVIPIVREKEAELVNRGLLTPAGV